MSHESHIDLPTRLAAAAKDFREVAVGLDDEGLAARSSLPGWNRAYVVAHVEGISRAMERQVQFAARGELIELYDGGYEGRVRGIELRAQRPAAEQKKALEAALDSAVVVFKGLDGAAWRGRISYRDGTVHDGALALWRELVIHASDLNAGRTSLDWDDAFCRYLLGFLEARVPEGLALKLQPLGQPPVTIGAEQGSARRTVVVTGLLQDIAAWLAGRVPLGGLNATAAADGVALPDLLPWPSGVAPK
ncbi:maleylpyruvate isomerase family mycothiol-dependent enzyme [Arthrobacter sp. H5]|uniref:maleylpyruvate isomerase family mycothiol-dependent enzyme n=1 Tax=Arthrobacter sp. H5 TaxID=1267973 RepID=UPI000480E722|nr:maleylpyruvate isomerase family mycothiol-dependent enzyme [Arthrobacter sp. H5]